MATKTNLKTFNVTARLQMDVGIEVKAVDFDSAFAQAKEFDESSFVAILGDFQEGEDPVIRSIWVND